MKITDPNTGQDVLASSSSGAVTSSSAAAASANASSVVEATKPSENDEVPEVRIDFQIFFSHFIILIINSFVYFVTDKQHAHSFGGRGLSRGQY